MRLLNINLPSAFFLLIFLLWIFFHLDWWVCKNALAFVVFYHTYEHDLGFFVFFLYWAILCNMSSCIAIITSMTIQFLLIINLSYDIWTVSLYMPVLPKTIPGFLQGCFCFLLCSIANTASWPVLFYFQTSFSNLKYLALWSAKLLFFAILSWWVVSL